jgi:hypothetical protein
MHQCLFGERRFGAVSGEVLSSTRLRRWIWALDIAHIAAFKRFFAQPFSPKAVFAQSFRHCPAD